MVVVMLMMMMIMVVIVLVWACEVLARLLVTAPVSAVVVVVVVKKVMMLMVMMMVLVVRDGTAKTIERANMAEGATDARHVMHIATSVKDIQGLSCRPSTCPRTSHRISAQGQSEGPSSVQRHPASSAYPRAASAPNCKFESLSTPERFVTELNTHPPIHPATRQFHLIIRFFIAFRPLTCQP